MDALALQAVKDECRDLEGTRIAAVEQYAPMEIGLVLKTGGGRRALTLSAQPGYARLHLSDGAKKSAASSALLAALRDHLLPGTLEKIAVAPFERVVDIHCQGRSPQGPRRYRLIAELIGNRGIMVFFSEPDRVILETLRRIRGADRPLVPGETYAFPPPMKKTPLSEATRELLDGTGSQATPADLARHLSATFAGLSRDMALEVLARAGLSDEAGLAGADGAGLAGADEAGLAGADGAGRTDKIWQALRELVQRVRAREWTPCIGRSPDGRARILSAVPLHALPEAQVERHASMSAAAERFYADRMAEEAAEQRRRTVEKALRDETRRLERLSENLSRDLEHMEREEEYRRYGELITSHLAALRAGSEEARVEDYFSGDREEVVIPMKPGLSPAENARWYFRQARKARDGRKAVTRRIAGARKRLDEVTGVREKLGCGTDEAKVEAAHRACVRLDLVKARAPRETGASKRPRKRAGPDIHPRRYLTSNGHLLLVGRNSRENEALTKSAAPDDIWLHARDLGGSHVILRRVDKTQMPSKRTLHEAARLAAYFSKGRGSATVPVDYTERRYVRKMKNGAPGQVVFTREKTLFVEPGLGLRQADRPGASDGG